MQLTTLAIQNFRGIRSAHIRLNQHSVLIGPNNCGKTTIIEALALLFGRDRLVRSLTEHDFFGGNPMPTDRIRLIGTLIGFKGNDPSDFPEWFRDDRAVPKWLDVETGLVHSRRNTPESQLACQVAFSARFDRSSLEVDTARYFMDDETIDVFSEERYVAMPARMIRDLGFFLVPASRTWDRVLSFGSELFRRVVTAGDGLPAEAVLHERDRLRAPDKPIEVDQSLLDVVSDLNSELGGFFQTKPELKLRITSTDSEGVMEAMVPHYSHGEDGHPLPARRHGSGLVSMQSFLLLLQFGRRRTEAGEGFWMAFEEPELHVPPPLQRRLIHRLQALSSQTFVSTHSPTVAAMSDPRALQVLRNIDGLLTATPLESAAAEDSNSVRRLFRLYRVDTISALMHDAILVPEGSIDVDLLRLLARAIDANQTWDTTDECRFAAHVGLIPTQDAAVVATYRRLSNLHPCVACIVDGDSKGQEYAAQLLQEAKAPLRVLRWPNGWTMEDIVGWVLTADPEVTLAAVSASLTIPVASIDELVTRLKSKDRAVHGLKQDGVAYDAVADAISASAKSITRARKLLNCITDELLEKESDLFVKDDALNVTRGRVFRP